MSEKKVSCCGDDVRLEIEPIEDGITVRVKGGNPQQVSSNLCEHGCCDGKETTDSAHVEHHSCCVIPCKSNGEPCTDC
jgi:hypothetical protein